MELTSESPLTTSRFLDDVARLNAILEDFNKHFVSAWDLAKQHPSEANPQSKKEARS